MARRIGTTGNDTLTGTSSADTLDGSVGDDVIAGGAGNDSVLGGAGNDTLSGGDGSDTIVAGAGNDLILDQGDLPGGQDMFVFEATRKGGFGSDTILGYDVDSDAIVFHGPSGWKIAGAQSGIDGIGTFWHLTMTDGSDLWVRFDARPAPSAEPDPTVVPPPLPSGWLV